MPDHGPTDSRRSPFGNTPLIDNVEKMDTSDPTTAPLNEKHVRRRFDRAAATFSGADFVHRTSADGLFDRMLPMRLTPSLIVDAGSAHGAGSKALARRFRSARVISLDFSYPMLAKSSASRGWLSRIRAVQADASRMPFANGSADLVFANLLLPWLANPPAFLNEVGRVLRKDGLFAFSTLGPSSFAALREAFGALDSLPHVNPFADMHNVGDALLKNGLRDPVLDVDYLTVSYSEPDALFRDLTNAGARNSLRLRQEGLTGKGRLRQFRQNLIAGESLEINLELVYGHAWGGGPPPKPGEYRVAASGIGRRANGRQELPTGRLFVRRAIL